MDVWVIGIVMGCLGYWLAHYGLETKRLLVLRCLTKARDVLTRLESDQHELNKMLAELESDRSRVDDDKDTTVQRDT